MILTPSSSKSTVHKNHCFSDSLLYIPARWFSSPPYGQSVSRPFSTRTMSSCSSESPPPTLRTVTISYSHLKDKNVDLSAKIEEGFGPNGLGILSISDVPEYSSLRQNLLRLAPRLACLPEDVKKELEDPNSRYNFGWSHGKEKLESGKPAFKALGKLILDVGLMVAYHCDRYVSRGMKMHEDEGLEQILLRSRCHKGRLLYYFPSLQSVFTQNGESMSSWCGWHTDHGSLTGLTRGMFMRDAVELPCPDSAAGLYIKTRNDQIVKVYFLVLETVVVQRFYLQFIYPI
ncbi:uncharacterized protein LOC114276510 isoform X10 [Camellia sinensis]|uniref:uncharacterized protein LOC114276510 isoform X10 n=1 Tax=Camellia sinensis TaxID=4442 RepID=UPI0010360D76|nr:uncharacterized protein LOC114276510 isoform X10 [Camellia sinensis]